MREKKKRGQKYSAKGAITPKNVCALTLPRSWARFQSPTQRRPIQFHIQSFITSFWMMRAAGSEALTSCAFATAYAPRGCFRQTR